MPLLILALAFGVVILLNYKGIMLGVALIIGALVILITSGCLAYLSNAAVTTIFNINTVDLLLSINLIQILGLLLEGEGCLNRIVESLYRLIGSGKMIMFLIPVITALIPGPGVVLLSAPIIEGASKTSNLDGTGKSYINFWFRAAIQASSPLTFSFVVVTGIVGASKHRLFWGLLPFTLIMLAIGYWVQLRSVSYTDNCYSRNNKLWGRLFVDLTFILFILVPYLCFNLPFSFGITVSIIWTLIIERPSLPQLKSYIVKGISLKLTMLVLGIMFFKSVVEIGGLLNGLLEWFVASLGVSLTIPAVVLSFFIGLVIGDYSGAGALIFTFLSGTTQCVSFLAAIYSINRIGCYLSPINSSRLLTVNYFSSSDWDLIRKMIFSSIPIAILAMIYILMSAGRGCT